MSLLFRFSERLVINYPEEGEILMQQLPESMEEELEAHSIEFGKIICDDVGLCIESSNTLAVWDPIVEALLQFLDETIKDVGIEDIFVYYELAYYGIAVDYEYWDGTLAGSVQNEWMQFELVNKEWIEPFINPKTPLSMIYRTPDVEQVFDAFRREGIYGSDFMQMKSELLGKADTMWIYVAMDEAELEEIAISNWYELKLYRMVSEEQTAYFTEVLELRYGYAPVQERGAVCSYKFLDESVQDILQELYEIAPSPDTRGGQSQNQVSSNTEFGKVQIFNAGQALCVGIYELFGYTKTKQNRLAAFFDFGIPYTAGRPMPNAAPDYQMICNEIAAFVNGYGRGKETRDHIHIILSHWHLDHCILALTLTTELAHTIWYVPCEGLGPSAQTLRSHIVKYGGRVNPIVGPAADLWLEGNQDLRFGKIDYGSKRDPNPGIVRASKHPHHHGMYLIVKLKSGNRVFLSGDCTYAGINSVIKGEGFEYLQASHHGGNYALRPAVRYVNDIPKPARSAVGVIYSSGPYSKHHHPDTASINEHNAAGWPAYHITHNNGRCTIQ